MSPDDVRRVMVGSGNPNRHYTMVCADHGTVLAQCRCPGPKDVIPTPCRGDCPPQAPEPDEVVD